MRGPAVGPPDSVYQSSPPETRDCMSNRGPVRIVCFNQKIFLILLQTIKNNGEIPKYYKKMEK